MNLMRPRCPGAPAADIRDPLLLCGIPIVTRRFHPSGHRRLAKGIRLTAVRFNSR